ncbi:MAG: hypothetical protein NWQ07_03055 [Flaviramulus sp.]|nr:hypothetical protein [Flaviramulus sp.]
MRKLLFIVLSISLITNNSCDDGDIITIDLEFGETFLACGESDLVLYKIKEDPSETLSILISDYTLEEMFAVGDNKTFTDQKSATLYYRTYSDASLPNDLFCSAIPPQVNITLDESDTCTANITTTLMEDDNDGVLAISEDINGNGNLEDDDTDGDGLPNYIDVDDDGDNIFTANENPDPNGDGDYSDAQDSDLDGIPDYLDSDDDGDGILTRDEENASQDNNPANDITNPEIGADFLNPDVANTVPATSYRQHTILQTYSVVIQLSGVSLTFLSQDPLEFGVLQNSLTSSSRSITPVFN